MKDHRNPADGIALRKKARQAKARLRSNGVAISDWAKQHNFNRSLVYEVLRGVKACHRGKSHRIAVLLGMKKEEAAS